MKNLILPFAVIALFAIGSCGNESVVNTELPKDLEISGINTVSIQFTNLPARFGTSTYSSGSMVGGGGRSTSDSSEGILNLSEIVTHNPSREIDSIVASKAGDTIQIIGLYKQERTSTQINQYLQYGSSHYQMQRVNLVIDTSAQMVNYLYFEHYDNSTNGEYSYTSTERSTYNSTSFTLKDVQYTRFKDSLVIDIRANDIAAKLSKFSKGISNSTYYDEPGHGSDHGDGSSSGFRSFLPFTDESLIHIVLKKK
ncbi:MAG: hypothetical protein V4642_01765 [Bacteroidota bacterium]